MKTRIFMTPDAAQKIDSISPVRVLEIVGMSIVVNGRFRWQRVTGVQRHAQEICQRLGSRAALLTPKRPLDGVAGHIWEQMRLPRQVGRNVLWSPLGTGPLRVRRQVITLHDTGFIDTPEYFGRRFAAWYRWLIPRLLGRVSHAITVSEFTKRQMIKHFGADPERITVVPNGVGFSRATPEQIAAARDLYNIRGRYLLYVGSLKPNKNLGRVLEAWRRLGLANREMELVVVGASGTVFGSLSLGEIPAGARFVGYVDDTDLPALYSGAEAFVFPSLYEGFGIPVVEAMSCGTPVVTANTTSLPEVCGDAAIYVNPDSVDSIADGMREVVENQSLRATLRQRGLRQSEQFTWERATELTWKVLETVGRD